jgi:hypothetical protein
MGRVVDTTVFAAPTNWLLQFTTVEQDIFKTSNDSSLLKAQFVSPILR